MLNEKLVWFASEKKMLWMATERKSQQLLLYSVLQWFLMLVDLKYIAQVNTYQVPGRRSGTCETGDNLIITGNCGPLESFMHPLSDQYLLFFSFPSPYSPNSIISDPLGLGPIILWPYYPFCCPSPFCDVPFLFTITIVIVNSLITIFIHYGRLPAHTVNILAFFLFWHTLLWNSNAGKIRHMAVCSCVSEQGRKTSKNMADCFHETHDGDL